MTIDELNALTTLTAADEVPVWDSEESGEPTKKITASNLAASVKSLGNLIGTDDLDSTPTQGSNKAVTSGGVYTAIQQSTAIITQSSSTQMAANDTLQISANLLKKSFVIISCQRYGYGAIGILPCSLIKSGAYTAGIGFYINSSRSITLKVSSAGLITILTTNDAINVNLFGIL